MRKSLTPMQTQGSKNLFCASRRIFRAEPKRHFSGRIFFQLGRNHAPRLRSLGAKKKEAIFEASFCTHPNTNIINETIARCFFFSLQLRKIDGKQKKKKTTRKKLCPIHSLETRRGRGGSCRVKANKTFGNRAKRKSLRKENAPACVNRLYHGRLK